MFKKAFQIVVTFGVLVGAYQGYLLAFAALTERIAQSRPMPAGVLVHTDSRTAMEATRIAEESFGKRSWQANPRLKIRMYDSERGFWIYAEDYDRKDGGKVFVFRRFAIVWGAKGGKGRKTATSLSATVWLNEALGLIRPGTEAVHVVAAKLEQEVFLRDDRGTPGDLGDDLIVRGPEEGVGLPYIEYTEKTNPPEIRTTAAIHIADRDTTVDGVGMLILLRKRDATGGQGGFDAQTAFLDRDPRIVAKNAGKTNGLPGTAKGTKGDGPTPLSVRSDGQMRIDFPRKPTAPLRPTQQGPPDLEGPTLANFARNVEVVRGFVAPDALNSDTLELTFLPTERPFRAVAPPAAQAVVLGLASVLPLGGGATPRAGGVPGGDGPLTELALCKAIAKGYAVWLRSTAQDTKAKCNELIYKKLMPEAPDETYLRADSGRQIYVEKLDVAGPGEAPGSVSSVLTIYATDAKIFDYGPTGPGSTVVARGPGLLETRPSRDKSAERSARWTHNLEVRTLPAPVPDAKGVQAPAGRQITMTGPSRLVEHAKEMALEARSSIIIKLRPNSRPKGAVAKAPKPGEGSALPGGGDYEVEHLTARESVVLTAPGKTIEARDTLDAPFEQVVAAVAAAPAGPALAAEAGPTPNPFPALASADKPAPPPEAKKAPTGDDRRAAPERAVHVKAHRIWAKIRQGEQVEIDRAWLSGGVKVRQEPATGKDRGLDVTGESTYIESVGKGLYQARAWNTDRSGMVADTRLAAKDLGRLDRPVLASIETEDYTIRGPYIGMDQSTDFAWVSGPGHLIQFADSGLLSDKGLRSGPRPAGAADRKAPLTLTISWEKEMRFNGRTVDPKGRPAAKGEFRGKVDAAMVNSKIIADELDTYTDRPVSLAAPRPKGAKLLALGEAEDPEVAPAAGVNLEDVPPAGRGAGPAEPRAELAYLEARDAEAKDPRWPRVTIVNIKQNQTTGERVERQRIEGPIVKYDKRTGDYLVDGRGETWLWRRTGPDPAPAAARPLRPAALRDGRAAAKPAAPPAVARADELPWDLTHIHFDDYMVGRFGTAKEGDDPEPRTADFYGVKVVNGKVSSDESSLDWNWSGWRAANKVKSMNSEALRVVDEPPPAGQKDGPARQFLTADGNAHAYSEGRAILGRYMTYDTEKGLFYAYGDENSNASIVDQSQPGQSFSQAQGSTVFFNTKTHEANLIDPTQIHLFDRKGVRSGPGGGPPEPEKEEKRRRPNLRPPSPSHLERRGFSGR